MELEILSLLYTFENSTKCSKVSFDLDWPISKTEMLINQSKANLDEKFIFGK